MRARLDFRQRFGQGPLRRRTTTAVIELAIAIFAQRRLALGLAGIKMRAGAPYRRIDHRAGPFGPAPALDEPRRWRLALFVPVAHFGTVADLGVAGSLPQSSQLPS